MWLQLTQHIIIMVKFNLKSAAILHKPNQAVCAALVFTDA